MVHTRVAGTVNLASDFTLNNIPNQSKSTVKHGYVFPWWPMVGQYWHLKYKQEIFLEHSI